MLDDSVKITQLLLNALQAVAIVVGGGWVYFKFIKGRTFAARAELEIDAEVVPIRDRQVIRAKVALKNAGLSKLPLRADSKVVRLYATPMSGWSPQANFTWQQLMIAKVFEDHGWVEPDETISDEVLFPIDDAGGPWLAFRAQASVWAERPTDRSSGTRWLTNTILAAPVNQPREER